MPQKVTRRSIILGAPLALVACGAVARDFPAQPLDLANTSIYVRISDPPFTIPALDLREIDPSVLRREVAYRGRHAPGTVVISIRQRRLYLIEDGGRALRFGIGVGREEGLNFRGTGQIGRKAKWPFWTPTANMIARIPKYAAYADGMPGGPNNPLGARALYLYRDGQDTHFRVHGTNEPKSIGKAVSSGCIRLFNHDIIYLYDRLAIGATVIVDRQGSPEASERRIFRNGLARKTGE